MTSNNTLPNDSNLSTAHTEHLQDTLPRDVYVYQLGVQELFIRVAENGPEMYKRAGSTTDFEEMANHNDYLLLNGRLRYVSQNEYGTYEAYHPYGGRMETLGRELTDAEAILLKEIDPII